MKPIVYAAVLIVAGTVGQSAARAESPWPLFDGCKWSFPSLHDLWQQRQCWCPNDYTSKPMPCVLPNEKGCVDDYCRKPMPCVSPNCPGCVDDYCPKTCPIGLGSNIFPWYQCGPPADVSRSALAKITHCLDAISATLPTIPAPAPRSRPPGRRTADTCPRSSRRSA